jgi:deoxyadenosine/deoxycytidine kinase
MRPGDMIISIDGNVFSGKTALATALSQMFDAVIVAEHSDIINLRDVSDEETVHDRYIETEATRALQHAGEKRDIILDRSVISLCAHAYATHRLGGVDLRERTIMKLRAMMGREGMIIPDIRIHTVCAHATSIARWKKSGGDAGTKGTAPALLEKEYQHFIDVFVQRCIDGSRGVRIDTDHDFGDCAQYCAQQIVIIADRVEKSAPTNEKAHELLATLERAMEDD